MSEPSGRKHQPPRTVNPPTIVSFRKRGERFTVIRKALAEDKSLSWEARGIMAYLMGKPPNWKLRVADLVNQGTSKTHTIRKTLNELRDAGYIRFHQPEGNGRFSPGEWLVADKPVFKEGSPRFVVPHAVDHHLREEGVSTKKRPTKKPGPSPLERDPDLHTYAIKGTEPHDPAEPLEPIEHNRFGPKIPAIPEFEEIDF